MYKLCKTEQSAARQRELEKQLVVLMNSRRYEEITVSDFCNHAGIPRKAFYRYFSSKDGALYALIDHTMLEYEGFTEPYERGESRTLVKDMESFFLFWKHRKDVLDALQYSGLSGILIERAIEFVRNGSLLSRFLPKESPKVQEKVVQFGVSGLMIMVTTWHHEGYPDTPREMAELALRLVSQPLFPNLDILI